jgi:hypothetical protein
VFNEYLLLLFFSIELFSQYVTPKNEINSPKVFADCGKMYSECQVPERSSNPGVVKRRRKFNQKKNVTSSETESFDEQTTFAPVSAEEISNYVQRRSH